MIRRFREWLFYRLDVLGAPIWITDRIAPAPEFDIAEVMDGLAMTAMLFTVVRNSEPFAKMVSGLSEDTQKALAFALGDPRDLGER